MLVKWTAFSIGQGFSENFLSDNIFQEMAVIVDLMRSMKVDEFGLFLTSVGKLARVIGDDRVIGAHRAALQIYRVLPPPSVFVILVIITIAWGRAAVE
jgi:hypothetical protein